MRLEYLLSRGCPNWQLKKRSLGLAAISVFFEDRARRERSRAARSPGEVSGERYLTYWTKRHIREKRTKDSKESLESNVTKYLEKI